MSETSVILKSIEALTEAQKIQTQGILKSIEANALVTSREITALTNHIKESNGTLAELKKLSDERGVVVREFREHQKFGRWCHKNWWVILLVFITFIILIVTVYEAIGFHGIIEVVKELK